MKVAIINNIFYPFKRGGADKISRNIADGFIAAGDEVFFISAKPYWAKNIQSHYRGYFLASLFYDLKKIPIVLRLFWHFIDIFDFRTYWQVKKILKSEKPDLVITNNLKGLGFLIPHAISHAKIKHIHILHDIQLIHPAGLIFWGKEKILRSPLVKLYSRINSRLFAQATCIISPSKWLLDLHLKSGFFSNSCTKVLPNPIEAISIDIPSRKNKNHLLFVGEIVEHKGIKLFVKTICDLQKKYPEIKGTIIGQGELSTWLEKEIKMINNLEYLGRLENHEVKKIMGESGIVVVPSLCYENSPTVIYEACQLTSIVIASRIGGISELVHELGGLLFTPGDQADLVRIISYSLNNYDVLQKQATLGKEKIKKYNLEDYINTLKKIS